MLKYDKKFTEIDAFIRKNRNPDFGNLLKVLNKERPERPTLFEFFMHDALYESLTYAISYDKTDADINWRRMIDAFMIAGYDYATVHGSDFKFHSNRHQGEGQASLSMNSGAVIFDRESFEAYSWPDPASFDYSRLDRLSKYLAGGMKFIAYGPGGVLENVIELVGYENLCYMIIDDPGLVQEIADAVGSRLVKYYEICAQYDAVGALISNDDWGFNSQTMLSTGDMRKYIIPWHKKIAETIHASGKPAILHSCGRLDEVMDDIIDVIQFDAKHSYEDKILPVEKAYEEYGGRIAILGGLDLDFVCRSTPEAIYNRAVSMLELTASEGGYALGSGNSIPYYVPQKNYLAMIAAAVFNG